MLSSTTPLELGTPNAEPILAQPGDVLGRRVPAAAIEIELAAMNLAKSAAQVDALLAQIVATRPTQPSPISEPMNRYRISWPPVNSNTFSDPGRIPP